MKRTATSLPYTELEVADGNFDTSRATIDRVIIHTMVGTWQGAAARFDNPTAGVSAHYGVKLDGTYIHWLEEYNTAYHAGDYPMNQRSIGIEHEDNWNGKPPEPTRPDVLYAASAKLVADICKFYNIPIDRSHILKHNEVSDKPTGCPDALDIDRIVKQAQAIANQGTATSGDNITRKSSFFDQIWLHRFGKDINTDNATQQQVTDFLTWLDSNMNRAGEWDQLCGKLGIAGDTNKITVDQIAQKITDQTASKKLDQIKTIVNG